MASGTYLRPDRYGRVAQILQCDIAGIIASEPYRIKPCINNNSKLLVVRCILVEMRLPGATAPAGRRSHHSTNMTAKLM